MPEESQSISGVAGMRAKGTPPRWPEGTPRTVEELASRIPPRWKEKLKIHKFKILASILGIFIFAGAVFGVYKPSQRQTQASENCVKTETGERMTLSEAKEIALRSECLKEGNLKDEHFCNQDTGTWWIDLDIQKEGCAPACVISVSTKKAEVNWRCTGLIPQKQKVFCEDPRPQVCTMECIVNPPYICGSDGRSYCTGCSACLDPKVEWYVIQSAPCGIR